MKDLKAELEKLLVNAEDCDLIARLAADQEKRETFGRIAKQLREMASELSAEIAARLTAAGGKREDDASA
ncbi:hypothetical protein EDE08_101621 [Bradyrhizobium sp. R2.2-H]|jgi:SepF-like predicted cell division protein (DUF552 family)|uniref:hypothetical protein n=1 Tax=unclassified Bradyrhizobium TaxID=2631580 RepID=UPI00105366D9|nr:MULTISPECIES: hypothetical protein [unclassified Bradyrhizobium]TCU78839.1 hypothetical protein EDE10_101622 [Bradyrhizobium sp. Y-H1]TCU80922.1 hypothetical protein EDE08_101621 [Bradyrhizobium sp. R2.2-H]